MLNRLIDQYEDLLVGFVRQAARLIVEKHAEGSAGPVRILFFCRSGKHRSVAASELLWAAIQHSDLVACPLVQHLCSYWWRYGRCQKRAREEGRPCPECGSVASDEVAPCCLIVPLSVRT